MTQSINEDARRVATSGLTRIMNYGRSEQEKNQRISQMMLRATSVHKSVNGTQARISEAMTGLGQTRPKGFIQRLIHGAQPALSPSEMKSRIDDLVARLTEAEMDLHKDAKTIHLIREHADEVAHEMAHIIQTLEKVASDEMGNPDDVRRAALDRLSDIRVSAQVTEQMRLSLMMTQADVLAMKERNRVLLDEHVPLWDKLSDALIQNARDAEAAAQLRAAFSQAQEVIAKSEAETDIETGLNP